MAYIGQGIKEGTFSVLDTSGNTYNGSNVTFSLGTQVGSPAQLLVSHDGVIQKPGTDYTLATGGTQITFTTAPASGASIFIVEISGAVGGPLDSDLNGTELILDADADTSITADTDDQIDIKIAGADDFQFTANTFTAAAGSSISSPDYSGGAVFNEGSADVDFRVESNGNANMLFLDGGNNRVILGSATSVAPMSLEGALQVTGNSVNAVSLNRFTADDGGFDLIFLSSRNATPGSNTIVQDNDELGALHFCADDGTDYATKGAKISAKVNGTPGANDMPTELIFATTADGANSPSERMSISAAGVVKINSRAIIDAETNSVAKLSAEFGGNSELGISFNDKDGASNGRFIEFDRGGTEIGQIKRDGTNDAISYVTSSDYRLKDGVVDKTDGIEKVKLLKPRKFYWKSNADKTLVDGFLAHEVSGIVPEAISGTKDETKTLQKVVVSASGDIVRTNIEEADWTQGKTDGVYANNTTWEATKEVIKPQGIDQSKLVPLLTAALKESIAKIEALEARVTTLEG